MNSNSSPSHEIDPIGTAARDNFVKTLGPGFRRVGLLLWTGGSLFGRDRIDQASPFGYGSDAVVGLSLVCQFAGELCTGIVTLNEHGNTYGAAALLRQLVEVEYLAWAFAEDEEEAANWLRASDHERRQMWQPRHLRERSGGRFRGTDYSLHCKFGGHPTREGARMLPGHAGFEIPWLLLDTAIHSASIWQYISSTIGKHGYSPLVDADPDAIRLREAMVYWKANDHARHAIAKDLNDQDGDASTL